MLAYSTYSQSVCGISHCINIYECIQYRSNTSTTVCSIASYAVHHMPHLTCITYSSYSYSYSSPFIVSQMIKSLEQAGSIITYKMQTKMQEKEFLQRELTLSLTLFHLSVEIDK